MGRERAPCPGACVRLRSPPSTLAYCSTTASICDCGGAFVAKRVTELTRSCASPRRCRAHVLWLGVRAYRLRQLRIPGIYDPPACAATARAGSGRVLPFCVRRRRRPNHIHADDLARRASRPVARWPSACSVIATVNSRWATTSISPQLVRLEPPRMLVKELRRNDPSAVPVTSGRIGGRTRDSAQCAGAALSDGGRASLGA